MDSDSESGQEQFLYRNFFGQMRYSHEQFHHTGALLETYPHCVLHE